MKMQFQQANTDKKIEMYVTAEELTQAQFKELLRMFPMKDLGRLEAALG